MSFRGLLRPGQGFRPFVVFREKGGLTGGGRPCNSGLQPLCSFLGMITEASPKEIEQAKQKGTPITHTIIQRGTKNRAGANDVLVMEVDEDAATTTAAALGKAMLGQMKLNEKGKTRQFRVVGKPKNPGELGHFLIYRVEERDDIKWPT